MLKFTAPEAVGVGKPRLWVISAVERRSLGFDTGYALLNRRSLTGKLVFSWEESIQRLIEQHPQQSPGTSHYELAKQRAEEEKGHASI